MDQVSPASFFSNQFVLAETKGFARPCASRNRAACRKMFRGDVTLHGKTGLDRRLCFLQNRIRCFSRCETTTTTTTTTQLALPHVTRHNAT